MHRNLLALFVLAAAFIGCKAKDDGPTPVVDAIEPSVICTAQSAVTVAITGSGFSPVVIDGLTKGPSVQMPQVLLVAGDGSEVEVPSENVSTGGNVDGTALEVSIPMGLVAPANAGDAAQVYAVRVINPNGNDNQLSDALTIVPPPELVAVNPPTGAADSTVSVTLTGTGFRDGMTVTLDSNPAVAGANVTITSDTEASAEFDLTGISAGTYSITVTNADGCTDTLENAFTVYEATFFAITGIDPPFGCMCSDTTVTITSTGNFVSTPRVEMRPAGMNSPVIKFERVAFIDENTLTAVVPAGAPLGSYDVTVLNPPSDGGIGTIDDGFRVVELEIPTIEAIVPGRGEPGSPTDVSIFGENFRDPLDLELLDEAGNVVATVSNVTPLSSTEIDTTFPAVATEGAYLVRVTNLDENTYSTYSNFVVAAIGSSGNLHVYQESDSLMGSGRRMLSGVSARDDDGNRYLYALGGDTGAAGVVLDTVEVTALSKYGELGSWAQSRNFLTTPRAGAAAVAVPIFTTSPYVPSKTYIYMMGGQDDMGNVVDTVERAVVLSTADAPDLDAVVATDAGTLDSGTWYYKVSAVLAATDPDNPSGETLASDEAIVTLNNAGAIELTWSTVNVNGVDAAEYRVYRTAAANGASQTELLIATVTGTSYVDSGATTGTDEPPASGSTGVWVEEAGAMSTVRWGHAAAIVSNTDGDRYIAVVGGKDDLTTGYLASLEYALIDEDDGSIGAFTAGLNPLSTGRAFFGLAVENQTNVAGFNVGLGGGARLFVVGGITADGIVDGIPTDEIEVADFNTAGDNDAFSDLGANGQAPSVVGPMVAITSEKMFIVGGAASATDTPTTFSSIGVGGIDIGFDSNGDPVPPLQSAAGSLQTGRALGAVVLSTGYLYFFGGTSTGDDALDTTERNF